MLKYGQSSKCVILLESSILIVGSGKIRKDWQRVSKVLQMTGTTK